MKKPFEPEDRVAIYNKNMRTHGRIIRVDNNSVLISDDVKDEMIWVHKKQVRRLVKKGRRRFWIKCDSALYKEDCVWSTDITNRKYAAREGWLEVVEVKKK